MLKQEIAQLIQKVLETKGIADAKVMVDYPADPKHGDYSTNVALIAAKKLGKNPMEFAEELVEDLRFTIKDLGLIEKIEMAKPGFINFWITQDKLMKEAQKFEFPNIGKKRTVVVEYSSPNIAKPFTIGHLRSTIIGDAVANLLEATGWNVKRDNHVGDWGTQFGKQIYAIKAWGNENELDKADRPVKLLVALYIKFHDEADTNPALEDEARAWFKRLEDGDDEARRLWQKCIDWSWKEFDAIYQKLGVSFTENNGRGYGEAYFEDKMATIITELRKKELLEEGKEGAQIVSFAEGSKLPPLMILKKDGASLYATRDLATDKFRLDTYKDTNLLIINEVGAEQSLYFRQLYKLEEMLGWFTPMQRVHIKHGLYRFKEGKMSTRKGNVIWLEDVLEEAVKRAMNLQNLTSDLRDTEVITTSNKVGDAARQHILNFSERLEIAEKVSIGAIKWNDLKRTPEQDIAFAWEEVLNMQGNSGPYMQYTYVRTKSILDKAKANGIATFDFTQTITKISMEERELLRLLARFDEVVAEAATRFSPSTVATYLFELAQAFNLFYQKHQIIKADTDVKQFRIGLTAATGNVIKRGLNLLGIQAPEKM
ncbi:MAG: arginine--tRNA ligase [Candidatus Levybacteria bacterium]|nr:arginine--tRNA ligase [Candidatus Levybacteria bacterium]